MRKATNPLQSPFTLPHPMPSVDGDKRDVHGHNPSEGLGAPRDRGKGVPRNIFAEGEDEGHGRVGRVSEVAADVLSTAMGGQRRSATGEYESEPTIHKTQEQEREEFEERMRHPEKFPRVQPGRE
jgi:hypothetical protein